MGHAERAYSYLGSHGFWGTRVLDPLLVRSLEPEVLRQVPHCTGMFPVERVEHEDVGMIPARMTQVTT